MALTVASSLSVEAVDWSQLDTILLDMDGTLLDLEFDNHFWGTVIPGEWGRNAASTSKPARRKLAPVFAGERGKLNWYCLDFWGETLELDIPAIKAHYTEGIRWRPQAETFLQTPSGQPPRRGTDHQRAPLNPKDESRASAFGPVVRCDDQLP